MVENMNNSIKNLLKEYLNNKEYDTYNNVLIKEITYVFVKKIQKIDNTFLYSSLVELLESAETYLSDYEVEILNKFYDLVKSNYPADVLAEELMEIYKKIKF